MITGGPNQVVKSRRYSASLLETIRSNLEGLQGYDVMALELIQNADDVKRGFATAQDRADFDDKFTNTDRKCQGRS